MVRETRLDPANFVYPLFVCEGEGVRTAISSMPGVFNFSIDNLVEECGQVLALGVPSVILFGIPGAKDPLGLDAQSDTGIVQRAIRAVKRAHPMLQVMADVCLCEYT